MTRQEEAALRALSDPRWGKSTVKSFDLEYALRHFGAGLTEVLPTNLKVQGVLNLNDTVTAGTLLNGHLRRLQVNGSLYLTLHPKLVLPPELIVKSGLYLNGDSTGLVSPSRVSVGRILELSGTKNIAGWLLSLQELTVNGPVHTDGETLGVLLRRATRV